MCYVTQDYFSYDWQENGASLAQIDSSINIQNSAIVQQQDEKTNDLAKGNEQ